ncbi:MAG: 5'-methylthioadenosine/S-adenosylhomocysteine nucleosidase [Candidatus Tectomicrobia bacterium]|nr:5'-methylthioadenosine/S-adenosylhomocysteine nucleosidase [Candidatus Tectomicrobia bacterium]
METLIMTPMQKELDFFLQSCAKHGSRAEHSLLGRLPIVRLPEQNMTLARGGTGKAQFALQTQHVLDTGIGWELVICAGAAGALIDGLSIGDVVVATSTVEHDYNNKFNNRPIPTFKGASSVITGLRLISPLFNSFRVRFGMVASGDEDVIDDERRTSLHQSTGALAVAWEGAGGARACQFSNIPFIEIRGITDAANHSAPSDFETNLEVAMNNVAILIMSWISLM